MFTADFIYAKLRGQPFVPLRIATESGETFDIVYPDLVMVGTRKLVIGSPCHDDPTLFDTTRTIPISDITDIRKIGA